MNLMRKIFSTFAVFLMLVAGTAHAQEKEMFTQARFDALQSEGAVVLVDIYAPWCPTCQQQQKAFAQYRAANPNKKFTILVVDYDKNKDIVRQFRAPRQATLLLYRGKAQHWFAVAESRPEVIAAELNKAIDYNYN